MRWYGSIFIFVLFDNRAGKMSAVEYLVKHDVANWMIARVWDGERWELGRIAEDVYNLTV